MKKQIYFIISTLFYIGYFHKAPGTFGSFMSLFLIIPTIYYFGLFGLLSRYFSGIVCKLIGWFA